MQELTPKATAPLVFSGEKVTVPHLIITICDTYPLTFNAISGCSLTMGTENRITLNITNLLVICHFGMLILGRGFGVRIKSHKNNTVSGKLSVFKL